MDNAGKEIVPVGKDDAKKILRYLRKRAKNIVETGCREVVLGEIILNPTAAKELCSFPRYVYSGSQDVVIII
jgi:hypothetical protein